MFDIGDMFVVFSFGILTGGAAILGTQKNARLDILFGVWGTLLIVNVSYLCVKHLT